jgi:hypothetical protein
MPSWWDTILVLIAYSVVSTLLGWLFFTRACKYDDVTAFFASAPGGIGDYEYPELGNPSNGQLVKFFADLARAYGRPIATPDEAREMLGLPPRQSSKTRAA